MNWGAWLTSEATQGFNLYEVDSASLWDMTRSLWDMTRSPPQIADPAIIKITSGTINDPDPPDNSDAAELVSVIPPHGTEMLIAVAKDARIGALYRLDLCVVACDGCADRKIRMCDCVVIVIAEC
jgi:hypothetical protein